MATVLTGSLDPTSLNGLLGVVNEDNVISAGLRTEVNLSGSLDAVSTLTGSINEGESLVGAISTEPTLSGRIETVRTLGAEVYLPSNYEKDYEKLDNKPAINDTVLIGNKVSDEIGLREMSVFEMLEILV